MSIRCYLTERHIFTGPCIWIALSLIVLLLAGCGDHTVFTVDIKATNELQYDVVRFKVKPGAKVRINLHNVSDMSHNLLVTRPGSRLDVVNAALKLAEKGPELNYTPPLDAVLWSIPLVSPGQTKSATFTAPDKPGVYPYVCTYPGHGFVMYGAMYVTRENALPDISGDMNIPESRRNDREAGGSEQEHHQHQPEASPHPYALTPPYLYNAYLEGASPASVAVCLPGEISYCWDETACRLQFAWKGGFLDMSDLWKGHFNASAKILGDIFFRDNTDFPIRWGADAAVPEARYKGYRLVDRYPEFHYTLNGTDVYELIRPGKDSMGLIRSFRIPHAGQTVWFFTNREDDAIEYQASAGRWDGGKLKLSPAEARSFSITMTSLHWVFKKKKK
ncbi:plastocyanin/azurin family copper-binding protein [Compostibacter hankyongensis]|uniref:Blue (type 1) copper domain-containing protein n=1 Tax=Compostibacter hankyongensis TaxID=1007089 RepID=A0ABP8FN74_9BACT